MIFFGARLCLLLVSPCDAELATGHRRPVPSACSHLPSAPLSSQKLHRAQRNNAGTSSTVSSSSIKYSLSSHCPSLLRLNRKLHTSTPLLPSSLSPSNFLPPALHSPIPSSTSS